MDTEQKIQNFIDKQPSWKSGLETLRALLKALPLDETVKWGAPVYCVDNKNVVGLAASKSYFGLWFFNGALLNDSAGHLVNAQDGKTKAMRQWRFTQVESLPEDSITKYCQEAIDNQIAGLEIKPERKQGVIIPPVMHQAFERDPELKEHFEGLTPGKQREYAEHIADAKREATQISRMEKITAMIKQGIGLNDKYR